MLVGGKRLGLHLGFFFVFFFQAEDGIRDAQESRGLGDVYKRQVQDPLGFARGAGGVEDEQRVLGGEPLGLVLALVGLSLIHI